MVRKGEEGQSSKSVLAIQLLNSSSSPTTFSAVLTLIWALWECIKPHHFALLLTDRAVSVSSITEYCRRERQLFCWHIIIIINRSHHISNHTFSVASSHTALSRQIVFLSLRQSFYFVSLFFVKCFTSCSHRLFLYRWTNEWTQALSEFALHHKKNNQLFSTTKIKYK